MASLAERLARDLQLEPGPAAALAASFLDATREDLAGLHVAVRAADAKRVAALAHHIKGAAANLEVEDIRRRAEALEMRARAGDLAPAAGLLSGIAAELGRLDAEP
jgi:HPt (histidine-containing phosphotransfer) domain-containing protein